MHELALFAGSGGGILGGCLLGWRTVCAVENDPFCREILLRRQLDNLLPRFPIWDDIQTFQGAPWKGKIDIISGGFPCQDISSAGHGSGIDGKKSRLWYEMARIISEVRPKFVFVENSPMLVRRGLTQVLSDFTSMGYDCRWCVLGATHVGAPHKRERIWILAHARGERLERRITPQYKVNQKRVRFLSARQGKQSRENVWSTEPDVGRVVNGVAFRMDRLKSIGNGQVPAVAVLAWIVLSGSDN